MLFRSALTGTEIAGVVGIHAIGDGRKAKFCAQRFHDREELVFAMEAAVRVVALVFGTIQFVRSHDV